MHRCLKLLFAKLAFLWHAAPIHIAQTPQPLSKLGQVCDVSSLQAVADLAKQVTSEGVPLHCLVNNAGVMVRVWLLRGHLPCMSWMKCSGHATLLTA